MNYLLSPSLLSADFAKIGEQLQTLEKAGVPYIHLDVMDGVFVPNISFGIPVIKSIRKATKLFFDVHLMIVEPENYIKDFVDAGADSICFHLESTKDPMAVIEKIKEAGVKAAITLKPKTPLSAIEPYLSYVDMVLVMTVEPGFGGQKFMTDQVEKIQALQQIAKERALSYDIQVDGGIDLSNVDVVLDAGATVIVAGSAVFGQEDLKAGAEGFLEHFKERA